MPEIEDSPVNHKKNKKRNKMGFILLGGMEDLEEKQGQWVASKFGAWFFDSEWRGAEDLEAKIGRLNSQVDEMIASGKQVIFFGISAGAGLAVAYTLRYPEKVRYIFSLSGLLDPNLKRMDLSHLTNESSSFREMAEYLTEELTPEAIARVRLPEKVSAYSAYVDDSYKGDLPDLPDGTRLSSDGVVPLIASLPSWVKERNIRTVGRVDNVVGKYAHLIGIGKAMMTDVRDQLKIIEEGDFD